MENVISIIINQFDIPALNYQITALKIGHINDSYILESENEHGYFLQKINHHIFKNVAGLQQNIHLVTNHLRDKLISSGENDIQRKVLQIIPAKSGDLFYLHTDGSYWRMYFLIKNTKSYSSISSELAYKAGLAFGRFQEMLSDIPHDNLIETIPDFHNIEFRLSQFKTALKDNLAGRLAEINWLIDEIEKRADDMCLPERLHKENKLPKRINHCDTKVNNLLFDTNDEPLCIVDLDTVMPGFVMSDFGDFMRTAANTGLEDDTDLNMVSFNFEIFKSYTKGYLASAGNFLTPTEIELLPFGAKLLTYMQLVRFLTDYLNGDSYYKIQYPEHNLQRSKAQFKLLQSIENKYNDMILYIESSQK